MKNDENGLEINMSSQRGVFVTPLQNSLHQLIELMTAQVQMMSQIIEQNAALMDELLGNVDDGESSSRGVFD